MLDQLGGIEEPIAPRILGQALVLRAPARIREVRDHRVVHRLEAGLVCPEDLGALGLDSQHVRTVDKEVKRRRRPAQPGRAFGLEVRLPGEALAGERDGLVANQPRSEDVGGQGGR